MQVDDKTDLEASERKWWDEQQMQNSQRARRNSTCSSALSQHTLLPDIQTEQSLDAAIL